MKRKLLFLLSRTSWGAISLLRPRPRSWISRSEKPIWLFGAFTGKHFADNSKALALFVDSMKFKRVVWCYSDEMSREALEAIPFETVNLASTRGRVMAMKAEVLVFSHGLHDLPLTYAARQAHLVRLGHGVTAFKTFQSTRPMRRFLMTRFVDTVVAAGQIDRSNKIEWGFGANQIIITGLPRWDLFGTPNTSTATSQVTGLLIAPTAREWVLGDSERYASFLKPWLDLCAQLKVSFGETTPILFAVHPSMAGAFHSLDLSSEMPNLHVIHDPTDIEDAITFSSHLVTDYSSIAHDFMHLNRPVVYFRPQGDRHALRRDLHDSSHSYFFGSTFTEIDGVGKELLSYAAGELGQFKVDEFAQTRSSIDEFADSGNCSRLYHALQERLRGTS